MQTKIDKYNSMSDRDKLDYLLELNRQISAEIKRLSTDGNETYANLLMCKIVGKLDNLEYSSPKLINWTPSKHIEYSRIRGILIDKVGTLGKVITRKQYENALKILSKIK